MLTHCLETIFENFYGYFIMFLLYKISKDTLFPEVHE